MATFPVPDRINLLLASAITLVFAAALFLLPPLAAIILIPLNTPLWSLIHEAIHKNFNSNRRINELAGRVMSVLFGAAFGVLRFGHLMHHQYNRDWESEHYTRGEHNKIIAWIKHYFTMLGGLYLTEILMSLLITIFPLTIVRKIARHIFSDDRHYEAVLNSILKPANVTKIRIDTTLIILFYGTAIAVASGWVVAITLIGRGVIISIMDNAYHYGTPKDNSVIAKELETSPWYAKFILNFNHHVTHHNNVSLPWTQLKAEHDAKNIDYTEGLGHAMLAQFKGPIELPKE